MDNTRPYEELLFGGNCFSTSAMTIESSLIKGIGGFDTSLVSGEEDYDCWLRLTKTGATCCMIEKALGTWRIREDSVSAKHIAHAEAVVAMLKKHFEAYAKETNQAADVKKRMNHVIAMIYCGCARELSLSKNRGDAIGIYKRAIQYDKGYIKAYAGIVMHFLKI